MSNVIRTAFWLSLFFASTAVESQEKLHPKVTGFIQLLIRTDEPTLAEYAKFSGECGGESELIITLEECQLRGWEINSESCINYTQNRCRSADQEPSFELGWLRERFSTAGKNYRLISAQSETEGFSHDLIEIEIGKDRFLLFHNTDSNIPTGLIVGVSKVNGKKIAYKEIIDYLKSKHSPEK